MPVTPNPTTDPEAPSANCCLCGSTAAVCPCPAAGCTRSVSVTCSVALLPTCVQFVFWFPCALGDPEGTWEMVTGFLAWDGVQWPGGANMTFHSYLLSLFCVAGVWAANGTVSMDHAPCGGVAGDPIGWDTVLSFTATPFFLQMYAAGDDPTDPKNLITFTEAT